MDLVPIDRLERDWRRQLAGPALAARLERWRALEPALGAFDHPAALLRYLRRSLPGERQDAVLHALLARAREDPLAGRLVLQAMLPAFKRLSAGLLFEAGEQPELWSGLLACAWERIRRYPLERRPRRVAANLRLDTLHCVVATHRRALRERAKLVPYPSPQPPAPPPAGGDVEALVAGAARAGAITAAEGELILATRIDGASLSALAAREGIAYDALRMRRRRAERRLLFHLGVRDVRFGPPKRLLDGARAAGRGPAGPAGGSDQSSH